MTRIVTPQMYEELERRFSAADWFANSLMELVIPLSARLGGPPFPRQGGRKEVEEWIKTVRELVREQLSLGPVATDDMARTIHDLEGLLFTREYPTAMSFQDLLRQILQDARQYRYGGARHLRLSAELPPEVSNPGHL